MIAIVSSIADNKRNNAISILTDKINTIQAHISSSVAPCTAMNAIIQLNPNWDFVNTTFYHLAPLLLGKTISQAIITFVLAPNAIVQSIYPANLPIWRAVYGLDLLQDPKWRPDALKAIALHDGMVMTGPVRLKAGMIGLVARYPVWINNTTFTGLPGSPYQCDVCSLGNANFWGFAQMNIDWEALVNNISKMHSICNEFLFQITYKDPVTSDNNIVASCSNKSLHDPLYQDVTIMHNQWHFAISDPVRWYPIWFEGVLVVIVIMSCLVSISLFIMFIKRRQHLWLLHSMLPLKVLECLQHGQQYAETFDNVTIMFSDIVSYTTMASHMTPLEVAELLNEVYQIFDTLVDKYDCYKVETIGDAFMIAAGVAGEGAIESAVKVAKFAQDIINQIEGFTSIMGHKIQIRVGIHSGPVVGSVIGYKMPHFCLFGDTVNIASRMESNSEPMRIHISKETAELLKTHSCFRIVHRGDVEIKGKGTMTTFWLENEDRISTKETIHKKIKSQVDLRMFQV